MSVASLQSNAIPGVPLAEPEDATTDLASFARGLFAPLGGMELDLPAREPAREPPDFGASMPSNGDG